MFPTTTAFKLYVFPTLALALASAVTFKYGTVIMIKGDNTRFKFGGGIPYSFDTPANPTAQTFSQLGWVNVSSSAATSFAMPASATISAANLAKKYIVTSSAAPTTITLDTVVNIGVQIGALSGSELSFTVDNTAGASVVTIAGGAGLTAGSGALTGSNTLTIPAGQFAKFSIIFTTPTAALIYRTL